MSILLAATSGDVTKAGKAIGLALGVGLGALAAESSRASSGSASR